MTKTVAAANAEISRCVAASSRPIFDEPTIATQTPLVIRPYRLFSQRFPLLSLSLLERNSISSSRLRSMPNDSDASGGLTYKDAGVDIDAGSELVRRIAKMAPDSFLVAGTDGVGTKLKLAFETGIHETIGIDLVAMSVNDIVTSGAKPLFFLDYFATSHLDVDLAEKVIKGIVDGCQQSDCALLGGEILHAFQTAEMPDFYAKGEYDLSGFAVGIVKKDSVIDGKNIVAGDVLIGLPSSGVHSNGFSLVRRLAALGFGSKEAIKRRAGKIEDAEMSRTFNMGIGMVLVMSKEASQRILEDANGAYTAYRIGEVVNGEGVSYH
ncbi:hypothetical protein GOBAR_AA20418 [Gossypium barbadense]|uniref:phosphoribosylformylglycinamidine cyclo-ligase n=1 Tax=Gossypium barbadense TaxID=3634 RepID=A0A2P5XAA3_GOSBA|nr:hypothetical protein GOBAR_AA20418 [Gossypium barbadense]